MPSALRTLLNGLTLLLVTCTVAHGNAGVFGGFGQGIELLNSKDIQMISEDILITPRPIKVIRDGKSFETDKADYICAFSLKNLSDHPVTIQVGFPLDSQFFGQMHQDATRLAQATSFYDFIVSEGQNRYPVRYSREDKDKKFRSIFLWDMTFAPSELKELRITYSMPFSIGLAGTSKNGRKSFSYAKPWYRYFENCAAEGFGYVTETGNTWNGKIERARFRIDLRTFEKLLKQRGLREDLRWSEEKEAKREKEDDEFDAKLQASIEQDAKEYPGLTNGVEAARVRWQEFRKQEREQRMAQYPIGNPAFFREIAPEGWKEAGDGTIVWDVMNYVPGKPITVSYDFMFCMPQTKEDARQLIQRTFKDKLTDEDAQDLKDIIKAFYGGKVNNPRIKDFLENQKWYPSGGQNKIPRGVIETIENAVRKK